MKLWGFKRPTPDPADSPVGRRVIEVVAAARRLPLAEVHLDSTLSELGFDSLSGTNLAYELEEEFDVDIPNEDVVGVHDVREIIESISRLLDDRNP